MKVIFLASLLSVAFSVFAQDYNPNRYGGHGEFQLPENTCVSQIGKISCKHYKDTDSFAPYAVNSVSTLCTLKYELYDQTTGEYKIQEMLGGQKRNIHVSDNGVTFVANLITINSIEVATVQTAKGLNKKNIKASLNKIEDVLEKNKCL